MIENLNGIHETVKYDEDMQLRLHINRGAENFPPHWHIPYEIIMPTQNGYHVRCTNQDFLLEEGDILVICPGVVHELIAPDDGERIIFQPAMSRIPLKELEILNSILSPGILISPENNPLIHEKVQRLMREIVEEYHSGLPYAESAIYGRFLEILVCIGRNHVKQAQQHFDAKGSKQKEYMEKFLFISNYINEHFAENLTLEEVASLAGFSKYHFTRLFKQYADTSFYKYLNQKRIAHAKNLLLDPNLSVIEVALQSGFSSLSAFTRMFRLMNNCTPTEFRKMYD